MMEMILKVSIDPAFGDTVCEAVYRSIGTLYSFAQFHYPGYRPGDEEDCQSFGRGRCFDQVSIIGLCGFHFGEWKGIVKVQGSCRPSRLIAWLILITTSCMALQVKQGCFNKAMNIFEQHGC